MKNKISAHLTATRFAGLTFACILTLASVSSTFAADTWQASFEEVCSKVDISGTLSSKELVSLIEKADKLKPVIESSSDPSKKRFLQRLKKCRSMYEFILESQSTSGK
jgi:hypothetical protein